MITLLKGDCRKVMAGMTANTFDAVVTDPPYGLEFMGKEWDAPWKHGFTDVSFRPGMSMPVSSSRNPCCLACRKHKRGKERCICSVPDFDETPASNNKLFQVWCETWAAEAFRVMKPGAYMVAFSGTRTYHRMVCAIEDAGFVIHPMFGWLFGSGFPKAANAAKAIDKHLGKLGETLGEYQPATPEASEWEGWAYGLQSIKPALEPICFAQKPMEGTGAQNLLKHGVGAVDIDACRIEALDADLSAVQRQTDDALFQGAGAGHVQPTYSALGRWPANVLHDGSDEVLGAFAEFGDRSSGSRQAGVRSGLGSERTLPSTSTGDGGPALYASTGSAARFFFSAKADAADRADSKHPTVKPVDLVRWLVTLITPPGGHILDPFAGTGTTAEAAMLMGFDCTLIEADPQHAKDIEHRIKRWSGLDMPLFST